MDRATLARVLTTQGPFVSLYLPAPSDVPNAQQRLDTVWQDVERDLTDRGVDPATIQAAKAAIGEHDLGATRAIIAAHGEVLLAASLDTTVNQPIAQVSAVPHLLPLLDDLDRHRPHVIVLADRTGADVRAVAGGGAEPAIDLTEQVDGTAMEVRKVDAGGWSQLRYQQRAENGWEENASVVAERIGALSEQIGAELVVGAGDERATTLIAEHLPPHVRPRWTVVPGGRGQGSHDGVPGEVTEQVELAVARSRTQVLERFAEERGQGDRAAEGLSATLDALRVRQVETLLLTDELDADRTAWVGQDPSVIALSEPEVAGLGATNPGQAPLRDVLVWSALGSDADVMQLVKENTHAPRGGVGAVLRFTTR